jgi:hypothetical protein
MYARLGCKTLQRLELLFLDEYKRFLQMDHPFQDESKHLFNGLEESHPPPSWTTNKVWVALWRKAIEIHESWRLETIRLGDPIMDPPLGLKRLIFGFHTLDYWPELFIHHLFDPMHIVKNVWKSLLCHILGEKDTKASRANLLASNIKKSCWTP